MSAIEWVLCVAFWGALLFLLLRFPGRSVGFALALALWPVLGPWATWTTLAVTVVGAVLWRHAGPDEQFGLFAHPGLAVLVSSLAFALLGEGRAQRAGVLLLALSAGWVAAMWAGRLFTVAARLRRLLGAVVGRGLRLWRPLVSLVRCDSCGGELVVVARPEAAADGAERSEVAATGTCSGCGARWVGVTDPARGGGLVWSPVPAGAQITEVAG